jgi:hypothetical protein
MKILVLLLLLVATPAWAQVDLCVRVGAQVNEVCQNIPAGAQPDLNAARIHYNARLNLQLTPSQFALELLKRQLHDLLVVEITRDQLAQALRDGVNNERVRIEGGIPLYSPTCGDDLVEGSELCDGTDDANCPGLCEVDCTCPVPAP